MFGLGHDRKGDYSPRLTITKCKQLLKRFDDLDALPGKPKFWHDIIKKKRDEVTKTYSHLMEAQ